jgi:predicted lipoprotein
MPLRRSRLLGLALLALLPALLALLPACDKKVISERVKPAAGHGGGVSSGQDLDGSLIIDEPQDAGAAEAGELSEVVDEGERAFSKRNLIESVSACALAAYRVFEQRATRLDQATAAWLAAPGDDTAKEARAAFRAAMDTFQRAETFRFGPMAPGNEPGGQGYRDEIYAYPHTNLCKVDQQLVDRTYAAGNFASSVNTARGFAALEYLEHYKGSQNACSPAITINVNGSWAALEDGELQRRRMQYAAAVAHDIAERAAALVNAFGPGGENFQAQLDGAGRDSKVYASEQAALNAISNALFYVDIEVKDWKLALPLGISPDCTSGSTCPEALESRFAQISTPNIAANLRGFRAIFQGCGTDSAGLGFDDWLSAVGRDDLAKSMLDALSGAEAAVAGLDPPLEQALVDDRAKVQVVYDAVKKLTDLLKTEFVSVLDLDLPRVAEGDND